MLKLRPVVAIVLRQYFLMRGNPTRILPMVAWVGIDMVLWGFLSRYLDSVNGRHINFVGNLLGAVLFWDLFTRIMQGVTLAFFEDVWSRNFVNIFASPLLISEYLLGLVITAFVTSLIGLAVMLAMAMLIFGLSFLALGAALLPYLLLLFLFGIALGVLACAMVLRLGPVSEWLVWPIPALLAPFAGVFYPLSTLPHWMRAVSRVLPPAYLFENMRSLLAHHPANSQGLAMGIALALLDLLLACWLFTRVHRNAVRSGLLARYSAESAV
ncbi:MAG TPA: ABC transporter permease [Steroidobacteraceae bacterium]|nr:ABC transporter permease [Steroidobacteraceae bacterium]